MIARKQAKQATGFTNGKIQSLYNNDDISSHSENRLFSCVTCGILCFACVAIVQPTEIAASYLTSADCSIFSKLGVVGNDHNGISDVKAPITDTYSELVPKNTRDGLVDNPVAYDEVQTVGPSSLGLLALAYGNSSDSEEDNGEADISNEACGPDSDSIDSETNSGNEVSRNKSNSLMTFYSSEKIQTKNCTLVQSNSLTYSFRHQTKYGHVTSNCAPMMTYEPKSTISSGLENTNIPFTSRANEDSSRLHVFCLQHAIQVKKWLESLGGANVFLVCHPDYPKLESQARKIAQEMEINDLWNEISFREASEEDVKTMRIALDSENGIHSNGDWAVKMGINLFFSANLSRSPLYSKQMPYNFIVYSAFGRRSTMNGELEGKGLCRQRKLVVVGKWCGKVWMSSQVHPLLVNNDFEPSEGNETCKTRSKNAIKRVKKVKIDEAENFDESCEELDSCTNRHRIKRLKKEIPQAENLDDSSSEESPIRNSRKQIKGKRRMKKANTPEPPKNQNRSKKQTNLTVQDEPDGGPTTRLRKRESKHYKDSLPRLAKSKPVQKKKQQRDTTKKGPTNGEYSCDMDACTMSFGSKHELTLHKRNICPVKGCGKKFFSHKYLVQHRRVHMDDRPLKCPWKGCKMTFKWAWARTEHIRVHTGARPYVCTEPGCGQTFRFVSDFSRHKRKTGHVSKKAKR